MKKLTPDVIQSLIVNTEYQRFELLTVCVLTLQNGFKVTGQSSPVSAENFNADIGKQIAHDNAVQKIWELEGYLLKQRLYETDDKKLSPETAKQIKEQILNIVPQPLEINLNWFSYLILDRTTYLDLPCQAEKIYLYFNDRVGYLLLEKETEDRFPQVVYQYPLDRRIAYFRERDGKVFMQKRAVEKDKKREVTRTSSTYRLIERREEKPANHENYQETHLYFLHSYDADLMKRLFSHNGYC